MHETSTLLTIESMSVEEVDERWIVVGGHTCRDQQDGGDASRADPRHHVFSLVFHRAVEKRYAAHQVDGRKDGACVKDYHGHWNYEC